MVIGPVEKIEASVAATTGDETGGTNEKVELDVVDHEAGGGGTGGGAPENSMKN